MKLGIVSNMSRFSGKLIICIITSVFLLCFSSSMVAADAPELVFISKILNFAHDVDVEGEHVYVTNGALRVIGISNPTMPVETGSYYINNCGFLSLDVSGSHVFVTQAGTYCWIEGSRVRDSLHIVDVSNPNNPYETGWLNITGTGMAVEVAESGNYAYVARGGLLVVNIMDASDPRVVGTFGIGSLNIQDIKVVGNTLFAANADGNLLVLDVSDPTSPTEIGRLRVSGGAHGIAVDRDFAYVAVGGYGLRIVDITEPADLAEVGYIHWHDVPGYNGYVQDVEVFGNFAFLADNAEGVRAIDVSDPTNPVEVSHYVTGGRTAKLAVAAGHVFAADLEEGLIILEFTGFGSTPIPTPEPFLDLPWDYQGKGMSFTEAALAINSYFDHEYPLLSSGLGEPQGVSDSIINYLGPPRSDDSYSRHDGYDYGKSLAKVQLGDKVTAAADGCAIYRYSDAGGNMILIDHGNRYQTRYLHLQEDGLITRSATNCVQVNRGNQIGKVGWSGRVIPAGEKGAHIHFMVVRDKNNDGNFDDNVPDGVTDPFGWQSEEDDPWPKFDFYYNGQDRTGIKSHYLWLKEIASLTEMLVPDEGSHFDLERFSLDFPQGATDESLNISMQSATVTSNNNLLRSIGTAIEVTARDVLGNVVNTFNKPFTLSIEFSPYEIYAYDENSLSIYASQDGINWEKVDSVVFDNRVEAQVDHLSYFALMGERVDVTAPLTKLLLSGEKCLENWYYTNVEISLEALDNEGGLGVDYTLYKINDGDWEKYESPITFVEDGEYQVDFYSVDLDENIEDTKSFEFKIYKTPLDLLISTDPSVLWPPSNKFVDVTIQGSDGFSIKELIVDDEYDEFDQVVSDVTAFGDKIKIMASRKGEDVDGRLYNIGACVADSDSKVTKVGTQVLVPHDMGN